MPVTTRLGALRAGLAAIYGLLNVSAVTTVATGGVHHAQATEGTTADYIVIQAPQSVNWDTMRNPGEDCEVQVAAISLGPDYGKALDLINLVIQAVDGERPTIDANHACIALQFKWVRVVPEPDVINGVTAWRAVAGFRILLDQVAA